MPVLCETVPVTEATPDDGVTVWLLPPVSVMSVGVSLLTVIAGELALPTVLPFASFRVKVNTTVLLPFATT